MTRRARTSTDATGFLEDLCQRLERGRLGEVSLEAGVLGAQQLEWSA
jgi:hypothetical protein